MTKSLERECFKMADSGSESSVLDFTGQGIRKIETLPNAWPTMLIYDKNAVTKIENLDSYKDLQQLSLAENQLLQLTGLTRLIQLNLLNVASNKITHIEGLKNLSNLTWLNLSGNNIKTIEGLQGCILLQHLDLSNNQITALSDLTHITQLKSLLLHGNLISSLRTSSSHLPKLLNILSLAENEISDLTEVSYLSLLPDLEQLSVMNNPCVIPSGSMPGFDYRPYVLNWCLHLRILDGYLISEKESLKAEWLYSQGKGRHFRPGQHYSLANYLASVCPLTSTSHLEVAEDQRLARILQQQRLHQLQLDEEGNYNRYPATTVQSQAKRPHTPQRGESPKIPGRKSSREETRSSLGGVYGIDVPASIYSNAGSGHPKGPSVKAWQGSRPNTAESSRPSTAGSDRERAIGRESEMIEIQDVSSSDESPSSASLLESETRYLPLHSDLNMTPLRPFNLPSGSGRPVTAPPGGSKQPTTSFAEIFASREDEQRPLTAQDGNRLEVDDANRGTNQNRRIAANFANSPGKAGQAVKPTASDSKPQAHQRKRCASPLSKGREFLEEVESDVTAESTYASLELKLLKAILANRKTRKPRKLTQEGDVGIPPHRSGYTPDKYTSPTRRSGFKNRAEEEIRELYAEMQQHANVEAAHAEMQANGASEEDLERTMAATKLQALWRGFLVRHKDPDVARVRSEVRAKRAEDHIRYLRNELDKQRQLYEHEKQLRLLQLEAVKHLWKEVQSLQKWKEDVLTVQSMSNRSFVDPHFALSTQQLIDALDKAGVNPAVPVGASLAVNHQTSGVSVPQPSASVDVSSGAYNNSGDVQKDLQLQQLQQQVSQLQDVLTSMSNYVFQGGVISADKAPPTSGTGSGPISSSSGPISSTSATVTTTASASSTAPEDAISVSTEFEEDSLNPTPAGTPVAESDVPPKLWPAPGLPTIPENLRAQPHGSTSLILHWLPSTVVDSQGKPANKPIIGYRLYINERAKGMIAGTQTRALLEGLDPRATYRVFIRAVSSLGESENSNVVEVRAGEVTLCSASSSSSGSQRPSPDAGSGGKSNGSSSDHGPGGGSGGGRSQGSSGQGRSGAQGGDNGDGTGNQRTNRSGTDQLRDGSLGVDSGYATSPSSTFGQKDRGNARSGHSIDSTSSSVDKLKRGTVLERLENKMKSSQKSDTKVDRTNEDTNNLLKEERSSRSLRDSNSPRSNGAIDVAIAAAASSPRIQEGLIKRLDQVKEKGMLGELKLAAKIHKRKPSPDSPTPMKALADAEEDASIDKSSFKRQNSLKYRKKRGEDSSSRRASSGSDDGRRTPSKSYLIPRKRTDSGSDPDEQPLNPGSLGSRRGRTSSGSDSEETPHKPPSSPRTRELPVDVPGDIPVSRSHRDRRSPSPADIVADGGFSRHSRGRASAREARTTEREVPTEKRSSSVGAPGRESPSTVVTDKPPLAKPKPGEDASRPRPASKPSKEDLTRNARRRTKSEQSSQGSSEDEIDGKYTRNRHSSGGASSSSDRSPSNDRTPTKGGKSTPDAKSATPKNLFKHKRSSSDLSGIKALPDRPESPAPKDRKPSPPSGPKQAPNSPRVRRSSSFSKALPGESKDGGALLRQCISLELLKAAKSQDGRSAAGGGGGGGPTAGSEPAGGPVDAASGPDFVSKNRIDTKAVIRRSIERLYGRSTPDGTGSSDSRSTPVPFESYMSGPRTRSMSFGTAPVARVTDDTPPTQVRGSNTAPAVLMTDDNEPGATYNIENDSADAKASSGPLDPSEMESYSRSELGDLVDSKDQLDADKSKRSSKIGHKAADLFAKLQLKLSANKT